MYECIILVAFLLKGEKEEWLASGIKKYYGLAKKRRIANMAISILALIAIMVVLITIYGQNVGNFVIAVDGESQLNLVLSETPGFEDPKSRLAAKGLKDISDATFGDVPDDIAEGYGSKNDNFALRYFAYSFYIKNVSRTVVDYSVEMRMMECTKNADSALRVMIIVDDVQKIYAKAKEWPAEQIGQPADQGPTIVKDYSTIPFLSAITLMAQTEVAFVREAVKKYTVVMWLEGWDPECTDSIKGAVMRMEMLFKAAQSAATVE